MAKLCMLFDAQPLFCRFMILLSLVCLLISELHHNHLPLSVYPTHVCLVVWLENLNLHPLDSITNFRFACDLFYNLTHDGNIASIWLTDIVTVFVLIIPSHYSLGQRACPRLLPFPKNDFLLSSICNITGMSLLSRSCDHSAQWHVVMWRDHVTYHLVCVLNCLAGCFQCSVCGQFSEFMWVIRRHIRSLHSDNPEAKILDLSNKGGTLRCQVAPCVANCAFRTNPYLFIIYLYASKKQKWFIFW